jgi:NAD(P)-dependent dehydrogenase (short-subunit alcohol dehydrogenase family)
MKFNLDGKVAAVTGGGNGIGQAIAKTLAEAGAIVHVLDMNPEAGQSTVDAILNESQQAYFSHCDVTDYSTVSKVFEHIKNTSGRLDILINNAGIGFVGNLENTTEEDFDRLYDVNVKGVFFGMKAAIPYLKEGGGVIINMASIASTVGLSDRFAYGMSKGAVLTMTYSVAKDYLDDNVRCNSISPARVHTTFVDNFIAKNYPGREKEMFDNLSKTQPIGRMGNPQEVADMALFLCSDEAAFITGTDFPVDGGFIKLNG